VSKRLEGAVARWEFGMDINVLSRKVMTTLLIVLLVLFLIGGGGWGYSRWRS
jgi:hypothetical protein